MKKQFLPFTDCMEGLTYDALGPSELVESGLQSYLTNPQLLAGIVLTREGE